MRTLASPAPVDMLPLPEAGELSRPLTDAEKRLQALLVEGLQSGPGSEMNDAYFERRRERIAAFRRAQKTSASR